LADPVVIVTVARMVGGQKLGRRRVLWTCVAAAIVFTVYTAIGVFAILKSSTQRRGCRLRVTAAESVLREVLALSAEDRANVAAGFSPASNKQTFQTKSKRLAAGTAIGTLPLRRPSNHGLETAASGVTESLLRATDQTAALTKPVLCHRRAGVATRLPVRARGQPKRQSAAAVPGRRHTRGHGSRSGP
jgi:hypothetical protein